MRGRGKGNRLLFKSGLTSQIPMDALIKHRGDKDMMKLRLSLLSIYALVLLVGAVGCALFPSPVPDQPVRRTLRVVLYPFVPDQSALFYDIEQQFEKAHPDIDLQIVDLSPNYYNPEKELAVTNTPADVYELDSVFLLDFIQGEKIQRLPRDLVPQAGQFLTVGEQASQVEGTWYGVPHWVCTNFLFFKTGDSLANTKTLKELEADIGRAHPHREGLLLDAKGKTTLGELYLDALIDEYGTIQQAEPFLLPEKFDKASSPAVALQRAVALCDPGFCRDEEYHASDGFYARQFVRKNGRALTGYSERLYYVISEFHHSCRKGECLNPQDIDLTELPLADGGSHPFAWVDLFTISRSCLDQCRNDAVAFIRFATGEDQVKRSLIPVGQRAPRYLLPALSSLYIDKTLLGKAPLYSKMYPILFKAVPVTGLSLNTRLRAIGKKLDEEVLKP